VLDVRPDVRPVAVRYGFRETAPKTTTVQKPPLYRRRPRVLGGVPKYAHGLARRKPWPQNVTLDPAVGLWLLTVVVVSGVGRGISGVRCHHRHDYAEHHYERRAKTLLLA